MELTEIKVIVGTTFGPREFSFDREAIEQIEGSYKAGTTYPIERLISDLMKNWRSERGLMI